MVNTTEDRQRWLSKIEGLLRKAESKGTSPEEAASFTAKAEELMSKWRIEASELRAEDPTVDPTDAVEFIQVYTWKSATLSTQIELLRALVNTHDCRWFFTPVKWDLETNKRRTGRCWTIYGMPEDLAAVQLLYASLQIQAAREYTSPQVVVQRQRECGTGSDSGGRAIRFKNSFMRGYAQRIDARLRLIRRHQESQVSSSTALVLVDSKLAVTTRYERDHPDLRKSKGLVGGSTGSGYGLGYEAGGRAKLQESLG